MDLTKSGDFEDVSRLLLGRLLGSKTKDFEKSQQQRSALVMGRTMMKTREPSSRLLQLPQELLADIVELLASDSEKSALANLALVNIECRQLARIAQFRQVTLDYSPQARALSAHLLSEVRSNDNPSPQNVSCQPSIGSCIRYLIVAPARKWLQEAHPDLYRATCTRNKDDVTDEERAALRASAKDYYIKERDTITVAIANAMPNIEAIAWKDRFLFGQDQLNAMRQSGCQHLKLDQVSISRNVTIRGPAWPLRSLHLEVESVTQRDLANSTKPSLKRKRANGDTSTLDTDESTSESDDYEQESSEDSQESRSAHLSRFATSLIALCAPTLEKLFWGSASGRGSHYEDYREMSFGSPHFGRLRHFGTFYVNLTSQSFLSILQAPLRQLDLTKTIGGNPRIILAERLAQCEPFQSLEKIALFGIKSDVLLPIIKFLRKHQHLKSLSIDESAHDALARITSVLAEAGFTSLESLSLHWEAEMDHEQQPSLGQILDNMPLAQIPEATIARIGRITSLHTLRLEAGLPFRKHWIVDHELLQKHLAGLKLLRRLVLQGDTYRHTDQDSSRDIQRYYFNRTDEFTDSTLGKERTELGVDETFYEAAASRVARKHPSASQHVHITNELELCRSSELETGSVYDVLPEEEQWELCHRNRVLLEVEQYAHKLKSLEWMFIGQLPAGIMAPGDDFFGNAVPLSQERDRHGKALEGMFASA